MSQHGTIILENTCGFCKLFDTSALLLYYRVVIRFFSSFPAPHQHIHASGDAPGSSHTELAFASLRAMQLAPELRQKWSCTGFFELLSHQVLLL